MCCWAGQGVNVTVGGQECVHPGVQLLLDFCFKLVHARKCGSSEVDIPHPNQRHYVTQVVAGEAAELGAAAGPPATDHGCSDHTAAVEWGQQRLAVSGPLPPVLVILWPSLRCFVV